MKHLILILSLLTLYGCHNGLENNSAGVDKLNLGVSTVSFYVGTYTGSGSRGIYKCLLHNDGRLERINLAAETENPSFLAFSASRDFLLAVNENSPEGTVESFRTRGDSLVRSSRSHSGGAHPCFVAINEDGYVLSANYSSGTIGLLKLDSTGVLSVLLDVQKHTGSGTTSRQKSPHAHSAWFEPGTSRVISVDLGTNELWFSDLDTLHEKLLPEEQQKLGMDPGAGPRHLAFHPNGIWIYVVNELNSTVTLVKRTGGGTFEKGLSFTTLPKDYTGTNTCADIHVSSDGKFVYASNRGHNSLAIFETDQHDGTLKLIVHQPTCGEWPRNFALSPGENYVLVANQHSNNIVSFKRDSFTGRMEPIDTTEAPSPVCILF